MTACIEAYINRWVYMYFSDFVTTSFRTEGVHGLIFKGGPIYEKLRYTDTCMYTVSIS